MKNTPYEKDFDERIGKIHLRGMAKERYAPIVNFLKDKIGIGKGGEAPGVIRCGTVEVQRRVAEIAGKGVHWLPQQSLTWN